jgi:hypothetical protein
MGGRATFYGQFDLKVTFYGDGVELRNELLCNELRNILAKYDLRSPFMGKLSRWCLRGMLHHSIHAKGHLLWGKTDRKRRSCIEGMGFTRNERSPSMGKHSSFRPH